jgi:hypothetical protein
MEIDGAVTDADGLGRLELIQRRWAPPLLLE